MAEKDYQGRPCQRAAPETRVRVAVARKQVGDVEEEDVEEEEEEEDEEREGERTTLVWLRAKTRLMRTLLCI